MAAGIETIWPILAAAGGLTDPMLLGGLALISMCLLVLGLLRRKATKMAGPKDYTREAASRIREQHAIQQDMETLIVKLSEAARELNAQMDTRFAKLELVVAEADRKTAALEALLRKSETGRTVDILVGDEPAQPPPKPAPSAMHPVKNSSKSRKVQKQPSKAEQGRKNTPPPATSSVSATAKPAASDPKSSSVADPRYTKIYSLSDQGQSPVEIARTTGQTTGEIELILNLRKSRAGT